MTTQGCPLSEKNIPNMPIGLNAALSKAASDSSIQRLAIVGGLVRDWLLKKQNEHLSLKKTDVDIVVEGSAIKLAKALANNINPKKLEDLKFHDTYDSASFKWEGLTIDISSAREEKYPAAGENPIVKQCSIEKDLLRRDFTINAIALEIPEGNIIDLCNGQKHLIERKLDFIHEKSVEEDPTRIIRGARYASRLGFHLTPKSLHQIKETTERWPWAWKHGDKTTKAPPALSSRLSMELNIMFEKENWQKSLELLQGWAGFLMLSESIQKDPYLSNKIQRGIDFGINPMTMLVGVSDQPASLAMRLNLPHKQRNILSESLDIKYWLSQENISKECLSWKPSQWCNAIEERNTHPQSVALAACRDNFMQKPLIQWWKVWRKIKPEITATILIEQGWQQGPQIGAELNRLRLEKIDNLYKK